MLHSSHTDHYSFTITLTRQHPRSGARLGLGVLVVALVVGGLPGDAWPQTPGPGSSADLADDIAAKREEAARITDQVEALSAQGSMAVEQYRVAEIRLQEADAVLFETRQRVEAVRRQYDDTRTDANDRIVAMYTGENRADPLTFLDARNARELGTRQHYAGVVARRDRAVLDRLADQRLTLREEEDRLAVQRETVAAEAQALKARQLEVEATMAERQRALDAAQGELAELVAEEQRRRQAEEEARARETARRRAEDEARRRAAASQPRTGSDDSVPDAARETAGPPPPVHPRAGEAVQAALDKLGTPYRWGANGPDAYDCSGLTSYAWASVGVRLPRSSWMQQDALPPVPFDALAPGDLVFFGSPVHHVGIYMGDGKMVNAPYTGDSVRIDSIYRRDYAGAGRPG